MFDAVYCVSEECSSRNPVMVVQSRKILPDLEEDSLQGFPNKEISKYEILNMACYAKF